MCTLHCFCFALQCQQPYLWSISLRNRCCCTGNALHWCCSSRYEKPTGLPKLHEEHQQIASILHEAEEQGLLEVYVAWIPHRNICIAADEGSSHVTAEDITGTGYVDIKVWRKLTGPETGWKHAKIEYFDTILQVLLSASSAYTSGSMGPFMGLRFLSHVNGRSVALSSCPHSLAGLTKNPSCRMQMLGLVCAASQCCSCAEAKLISALGGIAIYTVTTGTSLCSQHARLRA